MGQCMSRKAAGALAASAAAAHTRPGTNKMQKHELLQSPGDDNRDVPRKPPAYSRGVAMSFGFKRRPTTAPSIASNPNAARRLANAAELKDRNGNSDGDTEPLTSNATCNGRSTPRLMPPKKEGNATRVNRFGFRQPQTNRLNKVSDLNNSPAEIFNNNMTTKGKVGGGTFGRPQNNVGVTATMDSNRNRITRVMPMMQVQAEKCMLQSTQLPRPEPIRLIETKTAKTLANNNKKIASNYHEDSSSKDGSLTEDSGVGSHISGGVGDLDGLSGIERLNHSPTYGARRNSHKSRNLEIVRSGNNSFDVRDLDENAENCAPLPQLPSAFNNVEENLRGSYHNGGYVREMALEYQRHLQHTDNNRRKISVTSSEGFSDDYGEEKTYRDLYKSEKTFIKPTAHKTFLKLKSTDPKDDSSPPSSDEHEWAHGGEAMADEVSFSISSSDESKDREQLTVQTVNKPSIIALQTLLNAAPPLSCLTKSDVKNALLSIEDPKFAAIAAASNTGLLLDDETSPVDSLISCSESEEILKRKLNGSSSNSKDINEKLTPPSPGTPTNASNSLSLSDGKDDFLIDDEIADQPALVFEDAGVISQRENFSVSQNNSEGTTTVVDSTPRPKRRTLGAIEGSPLSVRNRKLYHSRAGSLDTLSPCESIASDDLMMDYDYSQSSGLEDLDRNDSLNHGFHSLDETIKLETDSKRDVLRDWSALLGAYTGDKSLKSNAARNSRLLWSRTGTPTSIPDSPKSLESKGPPKPRPSCTNSPLRLSRPGGLASSAGYDSDDSVRLDRANHTAMKQDIISIKTMLLKLRRILNERPEEDILLRSETHNPFDDQSTLTNGLFNGLCFGADDAQIDDEATDNRMELEELRRQVLFLQGQLEDKEKTVQILQEQMTQLANDVYTSNSAPASTTVPAENSTCNAATQTERIRPISAGPSLLSSSPVDGNVGSLVSASECSPQRRPRQSMLDSSSSSKKPPSRLWRKPGEPPSPQRYTCTTTTTNSSIPRRANSRTRTPSTPS